MEENTKPELLREMGKSYFFSNNSDEEKKSYGLKLILEAHAKNDLEATYIVAKLLIDKVLNLTTGDSIEHALTLMCSAANGGCIQARAYLNAYCEAQYSIQNEKSNSAPKPSDELMDFDGKPIRIDRKGVLTPIDVALKRKRNRNVLMLSMNVLFIYGEIIDDFEAFENAVIKGIKAWEGEYEVFGGQQLSVKVNITRRSNLFDNLLIMPVTDYVSSTMQTVGNVLGTKEKKAQISDVLTNKRSFASSGVKCSSKLRKIICIQSGDGKFDDYDEIMHVAKHEFGHALGLGDLYSSAVDSLTGVTKGTYPELDSYAITDKYYNLVMCDHHGPISNNDIEMVILAFRENKMQLYQPSKLRGKISSALGKGN